MTSCELDYRLSNSSESMDYEETDSDDDNKLQIVESQPGLVLPTRPALIRFGVWKFVNLIIFFQ